MIEGQLWTGLTFRHEDGSFYGRRVSATAVELTSCALLAR